MPPKGGLALIPHDIEEVECTVKHKYSTAQPSTHPLVLAAPLFFSPNL